VRIIVVGPGRAGGSLAVAADMAGHEIVGIITRRSGDQEVATRLGVAARLIGDPMPEADLMVVAVRDDLIRHVAGLLAARNVRAPQAVHLSGLAPTGALGPLHDVGLATGAFHPLQTFPDWRTGSGSFSGAHVAITAGVELGKLLEELAGSLGCRPFRISDEAKPLYHAASSASANYVLTALSVAERLYAEAGIDYRVARPLVEHAVANAFDIGPRSALTGPVARGDSGTVRCQLQAVDAHAPHLSETFRDFARATAAFAGTSEVMEDVLS